VNAVINAPGRRFYSAVGMSRQAPFVDAATSIDPQNKGNTFISYYTYGQAIATGLDLTIRSRFPGRSLDDFMGAMWRKYGKTEIPYTLEDVRQTLGEVTGDRGFADDYFRRYIAGQEVPDYAALFATVGFVLRPQRPGAAWWGDATFTADSGRLTMSSNALVGQPLYDAGVENGDIIASLDGHAVPTTAEADSILARHRPGDNVPIEFRSRAGTVRATLVLAENPRVELVPAETAGVTPSAAALEQRRRWLASRAGLEGAPR
jgi:predicted metalloprotease with PDZ domain